MNAATHVFELTEEQIDRWQVLQRFAETTGDKALIKLCRDAFRGIKSTQKACDKAARKAAPKPFEVDVSSKYGAPLGRPSNLLEPDGEYLCLAQVPLDQGGYDKGGAYWGHGGEGPLYCCWGKIFVHYLRAPSRDKAKAKILGEFKDAVFLRA